MPAPTLIIMICTERSVDAKVLTKTAILRIAPVDSMKVIWRIEVTTMSETGKEAMTPAREDRRPISSGVLK